MATGYSYGELEPKEPCPYCGTLCHADFVDIGIGYQQCGPYHCDNCKASEIGPEYMSYMDTPDRLTPEEMETGWYRPGSPPGPNANVDDQGHHIPHYVADTLYRKERGVAPRYDRHGRSISLK
jgi:hypothetical protein